MEKMFVPKKSGQKIIPFRARPHHERLHGSGLEIDHGSTPAISWIHFTHTNSSNVGKYIRTYTI